MDIISVYGCSLQTDDWTGDRSVDGFSLQTVGYIEIKVFVVSVYRLTIGLEIEVFMITSTRLYIGQTRICNLIKF
jgi:hypothetical protein